MIPTQINGGNQQKQRASRQTAESKIKNVQSNIEKGRRISLFPTKTKVNQHHSFGSWGQVESKIEKIRLDIKNRQRLIGSARKQAPIYACIQTPMENYVDETVTVVLPLSHESQEIEEPVSAPKVVFDEEIDKVQEIDGSVHAQDVSSQEIDEEDGSPLRRVAKKKYGLSVNHELALEEQSQKQKQNVSSLLQNIFKK